ncbi:hypothetical protein [Clavibacter sp. Sh2126]|uniref:hypothetical protein n=1 Tax=Clavibacter sp. Sh2126 TaxID=3397678 RepID=UPI0039E0ECF3
MLDRIAPRGLIKGVLSGLRKRSRFEPEKADIGARLALFGLPCAVAAALILTRTILVNAEVILAAAALLVGALLAGFAQVAGWREKVLGRRGTGSQIRVRALNEAGALILMSIHVSVLAAVAVFCVALLNLEDAAEWLRWVAILLSSIGPAALTYVAISLVIVANLLWDGFENEQTDVEKEKRAKVNDQEEGRIR